jgi:hypothetical protein
MEADMWSFLCNRHGRLTQLGLLLFAAALIIVVPLRAEAQLSGPVNFVVLRVTFSDFGTNTRFTTAQVQTNFNNIAQLWGTEISYGNVTLNYQFGGPFQVASPSATYLDIESGQSSSNPAKLINDAVAQSPNTINWTNVYGVVVVFADTRAAGFYRGITLPGTTSIAPPSGGTFNVHGSVVGENPTETVSRSWGRWAHEMGHQMQANPGNPWHPSNYQSNFEQMDGEYPAQSGMFNKQANLAYPGWMPVGKYRSALPPEGASIGLFAEERSPNLQEDFQAIKAFLTFGGPKLYYLISVRHHILGDEVADTHGPNGIPDEGVLIERVVEGGNPNINDCPPGQCSRWVEVRGNGGSNTLWHVGNTYTNNTDGIFITVRAKPDDDHYIVDVAYADKAGQPDVGINSWLEPPGNTYETTDIWIDSPVNGYGTYRYPMWSDLMGGTVPSGNGDDPAVGLVNRLYARVRNYGSAPAADVVVHFDITDPPGVGINGSNGFVPLGTVDKTSFPGLGLIQPGQSVDVYYEWTPNFPLTPAQIQQGRFFFHTCVRVRLDHVAGETFFANQDGDGQQENIDYFDAGAQGSPGAPGAPSTSAFRLRNASPAVSKEFYLTVVREKLPQSWTVTVNNGNPTVQLGPNQVVDVPITITQTAPEPVGSHHTIRVMASSHVTLQSAQNPNDVHDEFKPLGGVQFQVAVLRHPKLTCSASGGKVTGTLTGLDPLDTGTMVYVVTANRSRDHDGHDGKDHDEYRRDDDDADREGDDYKRTVRFGTGVLVPVTGGSFTVQVPGSGRGVCLYSGSLYSAPAGSSLFRL